MAQPPTPRIVQVPPLHELRIELERHEACSVKLLGGTAELFGFELQPGLENPLAEECKAAIFTWTGCDLEISHPSTEYVAEETPLPSHYNAHLALENLRVNCRPPPSCLPFDDPARAQPLHLQEDETNGPRVLVVGEAGSGKSTLCKSLINWAIRTGKARRDGDWADYGFGRKVLFVNLDLTDGAFTVPGTFSAAPINSLLPTTTPVHPFGTTHSTALPPLAQQSTSSASSWEPQPNLNTLAPMHNGLSFFYGTTEWGKNEGLTDSLFTKLGDCARRRVEQSSDEGLWRGGMIVDTPAEFVKKENYKWISRAVREFEINVLLVVGNERLQVEMSKLLNTNKTVTVVRVPKNSGATALDAAAKRKLQAAQIRSYFYGGPAVSFGMLAPHSMSIPFPVLSINRVGEDSIVPLSALPIGHQRSIKDTQLVEISPVEADSTGELMNKLCALPQVEGVRRVAKKRKRTATPQQAPPAVKEASKEPTAAPEAPVTEDIYTQDGPAMAQETASTSQEQQQEAAVPAVLRDTEVRVKREDEDAAVEASGQTTQATPAPAVAAEASNAAEPNSNAEAKVEEKADHDEDPYADYTEEEMQQLVDEAIEDSEVASSPVMGFVHITNLDVPKYKYTVLSPLPGKLPRTKLIVGQLEWQDS